MGEKAQENPVNQSEKKQLTKVYHKISYITFYDLPFRQGTKNPLYKELLKIKSIKGKLSGDKLSAMYKSYQQRLAYEHPVIRRIFMGQLLQKLSTTAPGFVSFMKLMKAEAKRFSPALLKHALELLMLIETMPPGPGKEKFKSEVMKWGKISQEDLDKIRPMDPFFESSSAERSGGGAGGSGGGSGSGSGGAGGGAGTKSLEQYGPQEIINPIGAAPELLTLKGLDPFQITLRNRLVKGYNEFAKELPKQFEKPLKEKIPFKQGLALKKGINLAIIHFGKWIIQTVKLMKINQPPTTLKKIFRAQISNLKFTSLPEKISVIVSSSVVRLKVEKKVKAKLNAGVTKIDELIDYASKLAPELSRKKMFRFEVNRTFLNRFYFLANQLRLKATGDDRLKYDFFAMALDSIKNDDELIKVINRVKPLLISLIKKSSHAAKVCKLYFNKPISKLNSAEINTLLDLFLPTLSIPCQSTQSFDYKSMKQTISRMFNQKEIEKLRIKDYPHFIAISNILQNLMRIYMSILKEKNILKAKQKIKIFTGYFYTIRKLLNAGVKNRTIQTPFGEKKLGFFLKNPKFSIMLLQMKPDLPSPVKKAIAEFIKVHNIKIPKIVTHQVDEANAILADLLAQRSYYNALHFQLKKGGEIKNYPKITAKLVEINKNIQLISDKIELLRTIGTESEFVQNELSIKKGLYKTRYLKLSDATIQDMSLIAAEKAKKLKPDYKNIFYITSKLIGFIKKKISEICSSKGFIFANPRISKVVEGIVLKYGEKMQSDIVTQKITADAYLSDPAKRKVFVSEIAKKINQFFNTAQLTDSKKKFVKTDKLSVGMFIGLGPEILRVLHAEKTASVKATSREKRRAVKAEKTPG